MRPSQEDREVLGLGLDQYNRAFLGETNFARLAIFVRDEATRITAGLDGYAYGGWLFVHYLWVHSDLRRRGIGRGLIAEAERRALVLGCHSAHLDTFRSRRRISIRSSAIGCLGQSITRPTTGGSFCKSASWRIAMPMRLN